MERSTSFWQVVLWIARFTALMAIAPVLLILVGEPGTGPASVRGWMYLAFFPVGFSFGYLVGWRWPLVGGCISVACMVISLIIVGRSFPTQVYAIWGVLTLPGILYILAGWQLRKS